MPKVGMAPLRRQQLIDAVIECIHEHGLANTTFVRVGKLAGITPSIIAYYFGDKDGLLMATMRHILAEHQRNALKKLQKASNGLQRIEAIVDANFDNLQVDPKIVSSWLAFWGRARHDEGFARLQNINNKRLFSNLLVACRTFHESEAEAKKSAEGIAALIDGVWLRSVLRQASSVEYEKSIILDFVRARLNIGEDKKQPGQHHTDADKQQKTQLSA